jgi:Na+-driven multidrug efflux pump
LAQFFSESPPQVTSLWHFTTVLENCLGGAGDTLPNMLISIAMIWVVQLPLVLVLPHVAGLGVYGIRWATVGGTIAGAVVYIVYFKLGRWKAKRV